MGGGRRVAGRSKIFSVVESVGCFLSSATLEQIKAGISNGGRRRGKLPLRFLCMFSFNVL